MTVDMKKSRVTGRIWQAISQSGVAVSAIPRDQLEALVSQVADAVLLEFNSMLDEVELPEGSAPARAMAAAAPTNADEEILWEGRPFLSLVEHYQVTSQRVRIVTGLIGRGTEDIELIRIKDVDHSQGVSERLLNIGDVYLRSADSSRPDAILRNVENPAQVHEIVRRAVLEARKRYPFIFEQKL